MAKRKKTRRGRTKRGRAKELRPQIAGMRKKGLTWKQIGKKLEIAPLTAWWVYNNYKRKSRVGKGRGRKVRRIKKGRKVKRPARATVGQVKSLRKQGLSWAQVGKKLGISDVTAWRLGKSRK